MGFSGWIWILWNPQNINVLPLATLVFEAHFKLKVNFSIFILTALYASAIFSIRKSLSKKFSNLSSFIKLPWLIIGDFNEISHPSEKFGCRLVDRNKMNSFNNFLNKANLIDLGFSGPKYTWTNGRDLGSIIRTRIDRAHVFYS